MSLVLDATHTCVWKSRWLLYWVVIINHCFVFKHEAPFERPSVSKIVNRGWQQIVPIIVHVYAIGI